MRHRQRPRNGRRRQGSREPRAGLHCRRRRAAAAAGRIRARAQEGLDDPLQHALLQAAGSRLRLHEPGGDRLLLRERPRPAQGPHQGHRHVRLRDSAAEEPTTASARPRRWRRTPSCSPTGRTRTCGRPRRATSPRIPTDGRKCCSTCRGTIRRWQVTYKLREPKLPAEGHAHRSRDDVRQLRARAAKREFNADIGVKFGPRTQDEMMLGFLSYCRSRDPPSASASSRTDRSSCAAGFGWRCIAASAFALALVVGTSAQSPAKPSVKADGLIHTELSLLGRTASISFAPNLRPAMPPTSEASSVSAVKFRAAFESVRLQTNGTLRLGDRFRSASPAPRRSSSTFRSRRQATALATRCRGRCLPAEQTLQSSVGKIPLSRQPSAVESPTLVAALVPVARNTAQLLLTWDDRESHSRHAVQEVQLPRVPPAPDAKSQPVNRKHDDENVGARPTMLSQLNEAALVDAAGSRVSVTVRENVSERHAGTVGRRHDSTSRARRRWARLRPTDVDPRRCGGRIDGSASAPAVNRQSRARQGKWSCGRAIRLRPFLVPTACG